MFLTNGTMQHTAEMLYNISNDIDFQLRKQYRKEIIEKSNVMNVEGHRIMLSKINEEQDKEIL